MLCRALVVGGGGEIIKASVCFSFSPSQSPVCLMPEKEAAGATISSLWGERLAAAHLFCITIRQVIQQTMNK
jgi:hypothetical protein